MMSESERDTDVLACLRAADRPMTARQIARRMVWALLNGKPVRNLVLPSLQRIGAVKLNGDFYVLEGCSIKPESVFKWQGKPSIFADTRNRHVVVDPSSVKFNGIALSGSIATPEKVKQKPGKGRSATA